MNMPSTRHARRSTLRAVVPGEPLPQVKAKTVTQAAADGTTRELLVAMRGRIATAVEDANTPARDLAALTKRLVEVVRDIEAIDARDDHQEDRVFHEDGDFDASAI